MNRFKSLDKRLERERRKHAAEEAKAMIKAQELKDGSQWIDNQDRKWCSLCSKTFTTLRRKHHCRLVST